MAGDEMDEVRRLYERAREGNQGLPTPEELHAWSDEFYEAVHRELRAFGERDPQGLRRTARVQAARVALMQVAVELGFALGRDPEGVVGEFAERVAEVAQARPKPAG